MNPRWSMLGAISCMILVLAGCSTGELDYNFRAEDGVGEWSAVAHESALIELRGDGSFSAFNLPSTLCEADWPREVSQLDWVDVRSFDGDWVLFDDGPYAGFLNSASQDCQNIPVYFEQSEQGERSMVVYLVPEEDAPDQSILRFAKDPGVG